MKLIPRSQLHYMEPVYLRLLMERQGHTVPEITHVLADSEGDYMGAIDAGKAPMLFLWMDEERWNPIAAFRAWRLILEMWRLDGREQIVIAIQEDSPFYYWARQAGSTVLGDYRLLNLNLK